jgi:hypothetical protein
LSALAPNWLKANTFPLCIVGSIANKSTSMSFALCIFGSWAD